MKKVLIFLAIVVSFVQFNAYADMEQTNKCNERIKKMEKDLNSKKKKLLEINDPGFLARIALAVTFSNQDKKKAALEKEIENLKNEIDTEKARLNPYKRIVLLTIKIEAWGKWDPAFEKPEIRLRRGDGLIAKGAEDTDVFSKSLNWDITNGTLTIYDEDSSLNEDDYMGNIAIDRSSFGLGVSGDYIQKKQSQSFGNKEKGMSYQIEYKVEY